MMDVHYNVVYKTVMLLHVIAYNINMQYIIRKCTLYLNVIDFFDSYFTFYFV